MDGDRMVMVDSEKITINIGVVDLGKVDLLVEEGFYANRTDFIRTAIRNQLSRHEDELRRTSARQAAVGVLVYSRKHLEEVKAAGRRLKISVIGMLVLQDDVPPELARETIESIKVSGVFRARQALKEALSDRIH
jgi:Arc/MetJ-type ribon-helix-helix transcriptional regulator